MRDEDDEAHPQASQGIHRVLQVTKGILEVSAGFAPDEVVEAMVYLMAYLVANEYEDPHGAMEDIYDDLVVLVDEACEFAYGHAPRAKEEEPIGH